MATLVLQTAGAVIGGIFGGPPGAILGRALGAVAGATIDQSVLAPSGSDRVGPRVSSLGGISSTEGASLARVYGRARVGGQIIWATRFEESSTTVRSGSSGSKGGGRSSNTTTFSYYANFAVAVCEGPIAEVRRIWADGKEIDQTKFTIRIYRGDETQEPDALIVAKEGSGNVPAYRGTAYVVFERMPLVDFGNRVPQLTFEVVRPVGGLASMVRAIDLIPGASEFAYSPSSLTQVKGFGSSSSENRHQLVRASDWTASLDALQALCPNLESVALIVSWFGDDLRAGQCTIAPRVENESKFIQNTSWSVAGLDRLDARVVSSSGGRPAYGGTPSDQSVVDAIIDLKARGLSVVFYPFIMMDIPAGNERVDPWTGASSQPAFPWRGRITCSPAPGVSGSVDSSSAAATQIHNFFGSVSPAATEWSFRRFIFHCANLCNQAGGVDAFLVGSELASLTRVRLASGVYPAATALAQLAADCKAILGAGTKMSYAANWTEYGAHVLNGGNEIRFPLDAVWSSSSVDFVGIDAYWPLSDWRDGFGNLDREASRSVYERSYLQSRMTGGEAFDWYYADASARETQNRTPISDGAYGKPWIFRPKDLAGWWSHPHVERAGGVELAGTTAWTPASKPIWLMETGCPAVDHGGNAPNVFPDAKSSEGGLPHFSRGFRDDLIQSRALEAFLAHFDPELRGYVEGANPVSSLYGGRMVDVSRIHLWAWDARPYPAFPTQSSVWGDAENWETGHWLNGRLESVGLDYLVQALGSEVADMALPAIDGMVDGYVLDKPMSPRAAIDPLTSLFGFDVRSAGASIVCSMRDASSVTELSDDDLVPQKDGSLFQLVRAQESELPDEIAMTFWDADGAYRTATAQSRRIEGFSRRKSQSDLAIVLQRAQAQRLVDIALEDSWVQRETAQFVLRPGLLGIEPGDAVSLPVAGGGRLYRIQKISDGFEREVSARAIEPSIYERMPAKFSPYTAPPIAFAGPAHVEILDLAIARSEPPALQHVAAFADPWTGPLAIWRAAGSSSFEFLRTIDHRAIFGETLTDFLPGPTGRIDHSTELVVRLAYGALSSVSQIEMLGGANAAAISDASGYWEIFSFATATLIGPHTWKLSEFVRGVGGEEHLAERNIAAGARFILLDQAVVSLTSDISLLGSTIRYRIGPAAGDYADSACVEFAATVGPKALAPYAPVRATARREVGGIVISFVRRSRRDADGWDLLDVPIGETSEAYEIEIMNAGSPVRTLAGNLTSLTYPSADELADFGAARTTLDLRIYQISPNVGRGFPLIVTIPVS